MPGPVPDVQHAGVTDLAAADGVPDGAVVEAFGLTGTPVVLPGGEGRSVLVGDAVLKPVDDVETAAWCARVLDRVEGEGFRVPRPSLLDRRAHRWAVGDRVAWGEARVEPLAPVADPFHALQSLLRPVHAVNQVIHGDLSGNVLTGNVLTAPGRVPAVIDFSPYWRPASGGLRRRDRRLCAWAVARLPPPATAA